MSRQEAHTFIDALIKQKINELLTHGPTEEDYDMTARDILEVSPLVPSTRGNVFNQLTHRQHGIAKPLSREILQRKRIEIGRQEAERGVPFNGTGCIIC